ncbi:hypothetical protein [Flavobacterium sp.]|uniref:hypothetical protein n=1 Tax=Flavobacterium sp. TaxID=239 RepID=UPI0025F66E98|nr:hypothetical protein [Flavobacterium sp.]
MKQKVITLIVGFLIYGTLFGLMMYYTEADRDFEKSFGMAVFFGFFMTLSEVFINPRIKKFFTSKQKNKE